MLFRHFQSIETTGKTVKHTTRINWLISEARLKSESFTLGRNKSKFYLVFDPSNTQPAGSRCFSSLFLRVCELATNEKQIEMSYKLWVQNIEKKRLGVGGNISKFFTVGNR
jgi:hypothetical protein